MHKFFAEVDKRSRAAMVEFLKGHFRYHTMNAWNMSISYAHNMKLYNLGLEHETQMKLYDMMQTDEYFDLQRQCLDDFAHEHNYIWQAAINGRSGGYLVLYQGFREPSGYKSFCTACGQKNWTGTTETGCVCGRCRQSTRRDFTQTHMKTGIYPGKSIDLYEGFEEWDMEALRNRVSLVQSFDQLADNMAAELLWLAENHSVEEEIVMVPQTRMVLA